VCFGFSIHIHSVAGISPMLLRKVGKVVDIHSGVAMCHETLMIIVKLCSEARTGDCGIKTYN
jgi:hypothetical protein